MVHLELPNADGAVPTVFLSYRRADRAVVVELADRLRSDLGPRNVFRDEDDLIGGQDWRAELDRRIAAANSILVIIGENWEGVREDGSRRIDDPDDVVRAEIQRSLEAGAHGTPTPVLVDRGIPGELPEALTPLVDLHAVSVTSTELDSESESDYPRVLAAVWYSLSTSVPNGIVVVAGRNAELRLAEFVRSLNEANLIDARFLSRFGANMCVISARQAEKRAHGWPDAIILADDDDDVGAFIWSVLRAMEAHRGFTTIAIVGSSAALAIAAGVVDTAARYGPAEFVSAAQGGPSSLWESLTRKVRGASTGTKIATVAAIGIIAAAGLALAVTNDDGATSAPTVAPPTTSPVPSDTAPPATNPRTSERGTTTSPAASDTTLTTAEPLADIDGPLVAVDVAGEAIYFPPAGAAPIPLYESDTGGNEPRSTALTVAMTPDRALAWVATRDVSGEPVIYRTSPPALAGSDRKPAMDGNSPAVDPTGTFLARTRFDGRNVEVTRTSDGSFIGRTDVDDVGTSVLEAVDVMWLDPTRLAVLALLDDVNDADDRLVVDLLLVEGGRVVVEQTVVIARGLATDYAFGGSLGDDAIALHRSGSDEVRTLSTGGQAALTGSLDLPGPARAVWFDGPERLIWVDVDGTLRVGRTIVPGRFAWASG